MKHTPMAFHILAQGRERSERTLGDRMNLITTLKGLHNREITLNT